MPLVPRRIVSDGENSCDHRSSVCCRRLGVEGAHPDPLFLEKVVEGTPRVFDRVGSGRGLALHALTQGEPRAVVVQILLGIAGHVQPALEPATRIELRALLAGMQGGGALRALPIRPLRIFRRGLHQRVVSIMLFDMVAAGRSARRFSGYTNS